MIMRKIVLLLGIVSLSSFLFIQCKKDCNSKELDDKIFTDIELDVVPYNGAETLVFKNSNGDSMVFSGQGRSSTMVRRVANPDHDEDECAGDYRNTESNIVKFKHGIDTIMSIELGFYRPFGDDENMKNIDFRYYKENLNYSYFYGNYRFFAKTSNSDTIEGLSFYGYSYYFITNYYSSLTLVNKTYTRVYELTYFNSFGFSLFYSVVQGLVGYKESTGTIWYLDRIN